MCTIVHSPKVCVGKSSLCVENQGGGEKCTCIDDLSMAFFHC